MAEIVHDVVFLVDVDNTLLDNDRIIADLRDHLAQAFGAECADRYWTLFEKLRSELGYADYLGALKAAWGDGVTTVFPRQGHYALDAAEVAKYPAPDVAVDHIGDLARTNIAAWIPLPGASHESHAATP